MKRDVIRIIEETKETINERYSMRLSDILNIKKYSNNDLCLFSINSFEYGYAQGHKVAMAEMKKRAKEAKAV